ncbi:MAG: enoyl-CoA hydratase-related protein [Deinococcales bacterium]
MAFETLRVEREDGALRIAMNRPRVLNALSAQMLDELRRALEVAADPDVRAVLLTGEGRGFSAGADLESTPVDSDIRELLDRRYHPIVRALTGLAKPVVAGVNGIAAGAGLSLALACDMRLLSSAASFAVGFTGIGLVMDASCSYALPRLVGVGRAFELVYSGRRVDAEEALRLGLGERVIASDGFAEEAWQYVKVLATGPTLAFALAKHELHASLENGFERQLELEAEMQGRAAASRDVREGVAAFKAKRAPRFEGR